MSLVIDPYILGGTSPPSITWHTAFWASDPSWSNPGDGNAVTSWSDYSGNGRTASVSGSTAALTYRAASASLNNQPAVEASGGSRSNAGTTERRLVTPSFSSLSGPLSTVAIGFTGVTTGAVAIWGDGGGVGTTDRLAPYTDSSGFSIFAGVGVTKSGINTSPHLFVGYVSDAGSGDFVNIDGTSSTTGNAGTTGVPITKVSLFGRSDGAFVGPVTLAFYGVYQGNVTSDPNWSAFKTWVASTYGLTIA